MTAFAIFLVLLSALLHALWNYVAKRVDGGGVFVWVFGIIENLIFAPFAVYIITRTEFSIDTRGLIFIVGSSILHMGYFWLLMTGYRVGDLSLVYPLARGIGPLLATIAAIAFFHESPTLLAIIGSVLICGGVFWLTGDPRKLAEKKALPGVSFAVLTGISIAAYTLWDGYAMSVVLLSPVVYQWSMSLLRTLFLTPLAIKQRDKVQMLYKNHWREAIFIAFFGWVSYWLILVALATNPVSYVAPMRTISTLIGVLMGVRLLDEGHTWQRLGAASAMVIGVFALGLG